MDIKKVTNYDKNGKEIKLEEVELPEDIQRYMANIIYKRKEINYEDENQKASVS